jgi:hypothetical protein
MTASYDGRGVFQRMTSAWNDFFFKPRDPTTLGLMRIMSGVFILYVHMAYTVDLYSFFGPNSWVDKQMTDEQRRDMPYFKPASSWTDQNVNVSVPMDRRVREAFLLKWVRNLPLDPALRRESLNYLFQIPLDPQHISEGLAFAEQLTVRPKVADFRVNSEDFEPVPDAERQKRLDSLVRAELDPNEKRLLPRFTHDMSQKEREQVRGRVEQFLRTMQSLTPAERGMVFVHLNYQAFIGLRVLKPTEPQTELQRTLNFLTVNTELKNSGEDEYGPYLPNEMQERDRVLNYMSTWSVDPRRCYGRGIYSWSIYYHVTNRTAMAFIHVFFLCVIAMYALGLFTRITSVITWLAVLSYANRNQQVLFGMDVMMNIGLIYLTIGPSGAALSLDRWFAKRRAARQLEEARRTKSDTRAFEAILAGPPQTALAQFVTRALQIHFCCIYAASGLSKLKGNAWWDHTAIWYTMANPEFSPVIFRPYLWTLMQMSEFRWLCELGMSFGTVYTLFLEIAFPFLVWRPLLRPYMVMCAILLHTGIAVLMGLTVFGLFMLVLLLSYIPPETVRRWIELGERRVRGSKTPDAEQTVLPMPMRA